MLISGVQFIYIVHQNDSVIHVYVSILLPFIFPFRLLQSIEWRSLCYTEGPCWLSILTIACCISNFFFFFLATQFVGSQFPDK